MRAPMQKSPTQALNGPGMSGQEFQVSAALAWAPWSQGFLALGRGVQLRQGQSRAKAEPFEVLGSRSGAGYFDPGAVLPGGK